MREADFPFVLALGAAHEIETGPLDAARLSALRDKAAAALVAPELGFLIAFAEDADYDSPNFQWLQDRFERFLYVDRVVVTEAARNRGVGRALYAQVYEAARATGRPLVCCEVNIDPSNPASDAFHAREGFEEVGRARLATGKTVRYLAKRVIP